MIKFLTPMNFCLRMTALGKQLPYAQISIYHPVVIINLLICEHTTSTASVNY